MFFCHFVKGRQLCELGFASLDDTDPSKMWSTHKRKEFAPEGANSFPLRVDPTSPLRREAKTAELHLKYMKYQR